MVKAPTVSRRSEPTSTLVAVVIAWIAAPLFSANDRCTVASYFAQTGQIGMQLALPQQAGLSPSPLPTSPDRRARDQLLTDPDLPGPNVPTG